MKWDELLGRFSRSSVFQSKAWLDYLALAWGAETQLLGIYGKGGLAGCLPLLSKKMWGMRLLGSPLRGWGVPHMGPAYDAALSPGAVGAAMAEYLKGLRYSYFEMKTLGQTVDLQQWGFRRRSLVNFTVDLRHGPDRVWQRFKGRARTSIRKAAKGGVCVRLERGLGFLEWYYPMVKDTFRRKGAKSNESRERLRAACALLEAASQRLALSAWLDGVPVAGAILVYGKREMAYWSGASEPRFNWACANSAIQWEAIQRACRLGLERYSMGGGRPDSGAGMFKISFGAEVEELQLWSQAKNGLLSGAVRLYERVNTWRRGR